MIAMIWRKRGLFMLLLAALDGHGATAQTAQQTAKQIAPRAQPGDSDLLAVIVVMRHGVRAPIESETRAGAYNAQPWPTWPVAPGVLSPHGAQALRLLGEFYRMRYLALLGSGDCTHTGIYIEANTTQRTIASAKAVRTGLEPQCSLEVHTAVHGPNPLFLPSTASALEEQQVSDATLGRMANQPAWFTAAFARLLDKMHHVLLKCVGSGCNPTVPDFAVTR